MLEVPQSLLEERRRNDGDRFDEMWEGVLHMVPPPSGDHQRLSSEMLVALATLAKRRGLIGATETGLFPAGVDDDYRQPDLVFARPEAWSKRGLEGRAALAVEVRSPNDETYDKLDWYVDVGVQEILVIELDRTTKCTGPRTAGPWR